MPRPPKDLNPPYQVIDLKRPLEHPILREPSKKLTFPLSEADLNDIAIIEQKFDEEFNMAGLAAPQIGIAKQIIIFAAEENPDLKKWRPDFTQTMPKTIWINPVYVPLDDSLHEDFEACFSVNDVAGPVKRFKRVRYQAYDIEGNYVEGVAEGFLARIIQHEVDHINGKLFFDYIKSDQIMSITEYRNNRSKEFKENDK